MKLNHSILIQLSNPLCYDLTSIFSLIHNNKFNKHRLKHAVYTDKSMHNALKIHTRCPCVIMQHKVKSYHSSSTFCCAGRHKMHWSLATEKVWERKISRRQGGTLWDGDAPFPLGKDLGRRSVAPPRKFLNWLSPYGSDVNGCLTPERDELA